MNRRLRRSPPDVVYTPIDVTSYADDAASVLAFDPDEPSIAAAREETPERLKAKVAFRVAGMMDIDLADAAYDVGLLSWSI